MYKPSKDQFYEFEETTAGVFGLFKTEKEIIHAAEKAFAKNYKGFDCLTPYPVHGLDKAMGLKRSGIPWVTFCMGLFGCTIGFMMQYLTHAHDWPLNIAGKPLNAWFAYIPITFEATVFFAALSSAASLFILAKLPKINRKVLHPDITTDKFALWIPSSVPGFEKERVKEFLKEVGSIHIEEVNEGGKR